MKKLKAFTLIELIVAIAVFGILMVGIMRMVEPISQTAVNAKVMNDQRNVENAIATYIGENLRHATNLCIVKGGTPENAVNLFLSAGYRDSLTGAKVNPGPVDVYGNKITDASKVNVIAFDGREIYKYEGYRPDYRGRLIRKVDGATLTSSNFAQSNCKEDGSGTYYMAMGNSYYQQGDYFLNVDMSSKMLKLEVYSDFYMSTGSKITNPSTGFSSTASIPVEGVYELKAFGNKPKAGANDFIFMVLKSDDTVVSSGKVSISPTDPSSAAANSSIIYFVYSTEDTYD